MIRSEEFRGMVREEVSGFGVPAFSSGGLALHSGGM
jgi:hypothetical protein